MTSPDFERLATLVQKRRTELRLGVEPAAKAGGISKDTWKRIEAALKVRDTSYTGVEVALQWAPGSCKRVLSGGDPIVSGQSEESPEVNVTQIPKAELERIVSGAVLEAAIGTKGSLTGDEILALNERVLHLLRERDVI